MSDRFKGILDAITRVRGVRGAMIVVWQDGLIVSASLMEGVRGNAVAALTSSVTKHAENARLASGRGRLQFWPLQASNGGVVVVTTGRALLVVALAEPSVTVGLVRLELIRAAEAVK